MNNRVSGKTIIVTGAGAGLGAAIAKRLAEEGANVIRTDIIPGDGIFVHDVTSEQAWRDLIAETVARAGRLDGLVNNAGMSASKGANDPEASALEDWRHIYTVNVEGVFLGCKYAVPEIARAGGGAIVNMSSIAALVPTPFLSAYGASKAAVAQFTRSLALHCCEQDYAIRCNSVHPGQVRTPMHDKLIQRTAAENGIDKEQAALAFLSKVPMKKWQEAVDIANGVLFLMSDEARFITGTSMVIDGGMSLTN
ncbi:SDR family oxidoreductase [Kordiimonas pumila]|uniref:SDR family oxidoreductase n=1 Tax=Kordiimonas pumila TaxID=2161677 RepID=A0ABV7D4J9_9PROT|nr:SDR family oxidoreductase [Kordiimonas pumila]